MSNQNFLSALNNAIEGIIHAVKTQRHMKIHIVFAVVTIFAALFLNMTISDIVIITMLISIVIASELFNTAVEYILDMLQKDFHITVKYVKDICAGAVLINVIIACFCGLAIFSRYLLTEHANNVRNNFFYLSILSLLIVVILVISIKGVFHKGLPLKGGMPSGHAAVSFSIWVSILFSFSDNIWLIILTLFIALVVSFSRLYLKIHKGLEVVLGAVLGGGVTFLIFLLYER